MSNKCDEIIAAAESQIGSPYVYGTWGALCTTALRKRYAGYNPSQREITFKRCQRLRPSKPVDTCDGCKYQGRLAFDCRGFTHWTLAQAGIQIEGQAVGSQWNTKSNWAERGDIDAMPDLIAAVFIRAKSGKWEHVGIHIGGGQIIHCSGEVKRDTVGGDRKWSHYAIPAGLYTAEEIEKAHKERGIFMRTLKKGAQGDDVRAMQEMLNQLSYSCGTADGIFGAKTEAAVKSFQTANGLTADGIAGPQTLELLAARAAADAYDVDPDDPEAILPPSVPLQPELPEDDDEHETPQTLVPLSYADAAALRSHLQSALDILNKALT